MQKKIKVSLLQLELLSKDVENNLNRISSFIKKTSSPNIIFLPEMFNTSFCPRDIKLAESMQGNTVSWMKKQASHNKSAIAGTLMIRDGENIYNRFIFSDEFGNITYYDKRHLFSLGNEDKYIKSGNSLPIINYRGWKICPQICYDLRFPVFSRNTQEYDLLIYLANWPKARIDVWDVLLKARSIENQCYTIGVNRIGNDISNNTYPGHSKIIDLYGIELASAVDNTEEIIELELSLEHLQKKRREMNFLKDRDRFTLI
tara:strand:- start:14150 stop:14926 length:777 start_codon:yes stop_codon:yes gene_type:complete